MNVLIHAKAADDIDGIFAWIARDNPRAAVTIVRRLRERIGRLGTAGLAHIGRPGLVNGTRELVEPPYIIVYRVDEERDTIVVLAVCHGAQQRPAEP